MSRTRYILYRTAWTALASIVVTGILFLVARAAPDVSEVESTGLPALEIDNAFWDPADPLYLQYLDWVKSLLTLDWGRSLRFGDPVGGLIVERAVVTAAYLLPALVFGITLATLLGYTAAATQGRWSDGLIRGLSYVVFAVPNFVLGIAVFRYITRQAYQIDAQFYTIEAGFSNRWNLFWLAAAGVILGTHVAAAQIRYVRAQSSELLSKKFIKTLRAKGRGTVGIARHVFKAGAASFASLFVAEVLGLLLVSVFVVEAVLAIPGLGALLWQAAAVNDVPVLLVTTWLVAMIVILANLAEDLLAVALDPRIGD
ncbi:peptide/nickel transport system permease protein [Halovenus aranensis]|uniref:Peptide/nickel transport system permease protein n=1 Tax=Halovenus aranensis TaxID=890420 RepID=A0A1G8TGR3_9EURY|nr:ABC transporter permease [Halovenus aranensis]SDJ40708.1 peptide/nickel transport system permease protein [Halovenus aranensis]